MFICNESMLHATLGMWSVIGITRSCPNFNIRLDEMLLRWTYGWVITSNRLKSMCLLISSITSILA